MYLIPSYLANVHSDMYTFHAPPRSTSYLFVLVPQKPHMHINFTRHFFKIVIMSILNLTLTSSRINIALLHDKICSKRHSVPSIGALTCFIDAFCMLKYAARLSYMYFSKNRKATYSL